MLQIASSDLTTMVTILAYGFFIITTIGIYYYARGRIFKWWSWGYAVFIVGWFPIQYCNHEGFGFWELFIIEVTLIGSFTILRGVQLPLKKRMNTKTGYLAMIVIGSLIWGLMYILGISHDLIVIPMGLIIAVVASLVSYSILHTHGTRNILITYSSVFSYIFWAVAGATGFLILIGDYYRTFLIVQTIAYAGVGVSTFFLVAQNAKEELEAHLSITTILGGLVDHDIRNYINIASNALELVETKELETSHWVGIASEALSSAKIFVNDTRESLIELIEGPSQAVEIDIHKVISKIVERVSHEYDMGPENIRIDCTDDIQILSNPLIRELLWNVVDNAVKHSIGDVRVSIDCIAGANIILRICDNAGGMPAEVVDVLNSSYPTSSEQIGLGLSLIKELAKVCSGRLIVSLVEENGEILGTCVEIILQKG